MKINHNIEKIFPSNHNQIHDIDKEKFLLLNPFTGALDIIDKDVIELLNYTQTHSELPSGMSKADPIVSLLLKRGYLLKDIEEEKKRAILLNKAILEQHRPGFLLIPTYNCNFRCPYCYEYNLKKKSKEFLEKVLTKTQVDIAFHTFDELLEKSILKDRSKNRKPVTVSLYGGEPFLLQTKNIVEYICIKAKEREWGVSAITNGFFLEEFLPILVNFKIERLQITLDGPKKIHDKRRFRTGRKPTFNKIVAGVEKAIDAGINILLRTNLDAKNMNDFPELISFYKNRGWNEKGQSINLSFGIVTSDTCKYEHSLSPLEYYRKLYKILGNSSLFTDAISRYMGFLRPQGVPEYPQFPKFYACGANVQQNIFDPHNYIYPCWGVVGEPEKAIGIYNSSGYTFYEPELKKWRRGVLDLPNCMECSFIFICSGGCTFFAVSAGQSHRSGFCDQFDEVFNEFVPRHIITRIKADDPAWVF
jgi:uncharacterized protein